MGNKLNPESEMIRVKVSLDCKRQLSRLVENAPRGIAPWRIVEIAIAELYQKTFSKKEAKKNGKTKSSSSN